MKKDNLLKKLILAQKIYEENFLNKEFIYIYEEKGILKEIKLVFNASNFKHLTGITFEENASNYSAKNFYKAVKNKKLDLSIIKISNFSEIKLNHFEELKNILYSSSIYYKFAPEKGNTNWLFIDSFITKNNKNIKSTSLGITKIVDNNFVPSSVFHDIPEKKGEYIGKVLLVGFKNISKKENTYKTIFRIANIENIPDEIKEKFNNLENYNCLTANILKNFQHKNGECRWMTKDDVIKLGINKKNDALSKVYSDNNEDEENFYKTHSISYYNISDLEISEEIEKTFIQLK